MENTTLANLLAGRNWAEPAIIVEASGATISYRALSFDVERLAEELRGAGLCAGEAVALSLPNGPELLVLFLALARAGLIAAPVNPACKAGELRRLFADIEPRAIIAAAGKGAIADAAAGLNIPIWLAAAGPSGTVRLAGVQPRYCGALDAPGVEDVALLLHTSGTEGRPKIVQLTHTNVVLAAQHVASHYALSPVDRTLVVMPLFHGHGLIGAALATLASGGAVIVPPRFSASRFWGSFRRHGASWYSAVPTIHQILLQRADADGAQHAGPRFIRSCSSALAPAVQAAMERRFGVPVIEAYGLTEASDQVASNPLPPGPRRSGTVGFGAGAEIAIIDANGHHLPARRAGEIVVRGPTVMRGYRHSPVASATAFVNGWLRTGDAGALDDDGYLTLSGRITEMINRGDEKISPGEIDGVLLAHPAVAEAAAYGVPDPKYGEDVHAAVVLKADAGVDDVLAFCRERLAGFKAPKVIRIVSRLPKNALGNVERHALATVYAPPTGESSPHDRADPRIGESPRTAA